MWLKEMIPSHILWWIPCEKYMDTDVEYSYRANKGGHDHDVSMEDSLEFSFSMDDIGSNDAATGNSNNNVNHEKSHREYFYYRFE